MVGADVREPLIALTFDDGPDPQYTPALLDLFDQFRARATFFLLGRNVERYPDVVRRMVLDGHAIGNHTYSHPDLTACSPLEVRDELTMCGQAIQQAAGIQPKLMRPPFGAQLPDTYIVATAMGYTIVHWSSSGDDWLGDSGAVVADRVLTRISPGAIVLLHDSLEPPRQDDHSLGGLDWTQVCDRRPTVDAVRQILDTLTSSGYRFVTVPELVRAGGARLESWFVDL